MNSAIVAHYLYRQQPFASVIIDLQNGKFDVPDRMLHSYQCLYDNVLRHGNKEHIQNILYSAKMFFNLFDFQIGRR